MLKRAPTFRVALDHKLETLRRAFGSSSEAARQCKVGLRTFNRWRAGHFPEAAVLPKVDEAYAMAVEILNDPQLLKKRKETSKEIHRLASKLHLSADTVRLLQAEGLY